MELVKQPETEVEYWEAIEALGGYIWRTKHDGRMALNDEIEKSLQSAEELSERLVAEIGEKFGIIDYPKFEFGQTPPLAPEGKTYYWDWYKRMKQEVYRKEYEGLICSACPLSTGLEHMVALGGVIPCGVWRGGDIPPSHTLSVCHDRHRKLERKKAPRRNWEKGNPICPITI